VIPKRSRQRFQLHQGLPAFTQFEPQFRALDPKSNSEHRRFGIHFHFKLISTKLSLELK